MDAMGIYDPVTLDQVPAVNELLSRLGLGKLADGDVTAHVGRNDSWAGRTSSGADVFVKLIGDTDGGATARLRRVRDFDAAARRAGVPSPPLLGFDEAAGLVVHALLPDSRTGAELAKDDEFTDEHAAEVGRMIARLHALPAEAAPDLSPPDHPMMSLLDALPLPLFLSLNAAELRFWGILQADGELAAALRRLRDLERAAPARPAHCDLRLDQLLWWDGGLYLTDGEEFRLADPARDIGGFAGEWLHRAVMGMAGVGEDDGPRYEPSHEEIVARGAAGVERLRPRVEAFWAAYRSASGPVEPDLAVRATAFAGWHLIERAGAVASRSTRLSALARAAMGIGRTALLAPERFVTTVGLGGGR